MIQSKFYENCFTLRLKCLDIIKNTGASHIGSIFSCLDIIVYIYSYIIKFKNLSSNHDFILSKGHAGLAVYLTLFLKKIINHKTLNSYYKNGSKLSGHISHYKVPGIEISTGSLGHGLSIGCGFAYANKLKKNLKKTFVLISDGECNEGSIWEAALFASHKKLNNLICIIDYNKIQSLESVKKTLNIEPLSDKWRSFGWKVIKINGHSFKDLNKISKKNLSNKPLCIIANTIKGYGVSFMQNKVLWHYRSPDKNEYEKAKKELTKRLK